MKTLNEMNKVELRAACKEHGVKNYGKMTNDGMREALEAHHAASAKQEEKVEQAAPATESASVDLNTLTLTEDDNCPHCGIHLSNGIGDFEQLIELHGPKKAHQLAQREFQCLACDGEWGPLRGKYAAKPATATGKGIKIQKDREERNGMKRPSAGGKCAQVWEMMDKWYAESGQIIAKKEFLEYAESQGWNRNMASSQRAYWTKFMGLTRK